PDVDVVFLHRGDEQRARDRATERRGVEVRHAGGGDVEGARLKRGNSFEHERPAAVDEPRLFGAVLLCAPRDVVVVRLVRLPEIRGVRVRNRAALAHPVKGRARVEAAGKRDADFLAGRQRLEDRCHCCQRNSVRLDYTWNNVAKPRSTMPVDTSQSVLHAIGRTPLMRLRSVVPPGAADVLVKLEFYNPTRSYKDRTPLAIIH